jgi:hypothetical protein
MSTLILACQADPGIKKQLDDLDVQLDALETAIDAALDNVTDADSAAMAKELTSVINDHNEAFTASNPGSLNEAFKDSEITRIDRTQRDAELRMEKRGFCVVNGAIYAMNNGIGNASTEALTLQFGQGLAAIPELRVILGDDTYVDPVITVPPSSSSMTRQRDAQSCTGTYNAGGTIDQLRELSKAFGGNLVDVKTFIKDTWKNGVGVVWSLPMTEVVAATDDGSTFDYDVVRASLSQPAFDEDILITDRTALVFSERFIARDASRAYAEAVARDFYTEQGWKGNPQLVCRVLRHSDTEDVRNQTPVLRTSGFDESKLGVTAYKLGIKVGGLARVVDVTGDQGSRTLFDKYNADSVASAISRVFGLYLRVAGYGNEISFATADRGPNASISFFYVGDGDASEALGIDGILQRSAANANRSGGVAPDSSITLKQAGSATWTGGDLSGTQVSAAVINALLNYELTDKQFSCMLSGTSYWEAVSDIGSAQATALEDQCDALSTKSNREFVALTREPVRALTDTYGFVDLNVFRTRDGLAMFDILGDGLADVLNKRPTIDELDIYESQDAVRSRLLSAVDAHIDSDGIEDITYDTTIINAFRQNHGKFAYALAIFNRLDRDFELLAHDEAIDLRERFCGYSASMAPSIVGIISKADLENKSQRASTLWDDIVDLAGDIVNPNAAQNLLASMLDYICQSDAETCAKLKNFWEDSQSLANRYEGKLADFIGDLVSSTLGEAYRALVGAIAMINRLLERAQKLVRKGRERATKFFQSAFDTNKTLPEILEDLANLNYNVYGNMSWQTKFVSCYVSGGADVLLSALFAKLMDKINGIIAKINDKIQALMKSIIDALNVIECLADKLMNSFSGYMSYEMSGAGNYVAMGLVPIPVSFKLNCTASIGFGGGDPALAREIAKLKANIRILLGLLQLQSLKFNQLDKSVLVYKSMEISASEGAAAIIEQIRQQIMDKLKSLTAC